MKHLPGVAIAALVAAVAFGVVHFVPGVPALALCVLLGVVFANLGAFPAAATAGLRLCAKRLLRVGIVLLGLQLSVHQIVDLGLERVGLVVGTVVVTFFFTVWLGERLNLSRSLSILTATGFSICGASAIAGAKDIVGADDDETAYAVALVTLCGSLAILVLPIAAHVIGLRDAAFGSWIGASVHDVAQVVAAGSLGGAVALQVAVVVKLARVILLAPMLAVLSTYERRRANATATRAKVAIVPLFVAGFLIAIAVRTTNLLPSSVLHGASVAQQTLLALALVGLGAGVNVSRLRALGARPVLLALGSWLMVASVSLAGVLALG